MVNRLYVRRCRKVHVPDGTAKQAPGTLGALLKNCEGLGFALRPEVIERLGVLGTDELDCFNRDLMATLRKMTGADVKFAPMYPNFPAQVMEADEAELYVNAMMHYFGDWVGVRIMPEYEKEARPALDESTPLKPIALGSIEELKDITRQLMGSKTSLSQTDRADLGHLIGFFAADLEELIPEAIPFKETLALVTREVLAHHPEAAEALHPHFKTATDLLRLAVALSEGDISLASPTRFTKLPRAQRRFFLSRLNDIRAPREDMQRHTGPWIRLGERLHPGEYRKRFPRAADAFDALRKGERVETFNARIERALLHNDLPAALSQLELRPGELARRLDVLLRRSQDPQAVLDAFDRIAGKLPSPMLLHLMTHFRRRNEPRELRVFFPKGNLARAYAVPHRLPPVDQEACRALAATCDRVLLGRFGALPALGKVHIDAALRSFPVPLAQRSASASLRTLARGTRLALPDGNTVRFFLWWKEGTLRGQDRRTGRVDLDLSAVMYDANWNYREHVSYTKLRSLKYKAAHSGDITSAPKGACEFIDLDLPSVSRFGARYIVFSVFSFTRQPFCELPECFAGWMMRKKPNSGEVFEPRTVCDKVDLASETRICIPVIMDVVRREMWWCDLGLTRNVAWQNSLEGNQRGMVLMGLAMTNLVQPDLHYLFRLHAEARGERVHDPKTADLRIGPEGDITPYDQSRIMSEFL